MEAIGGEDPYNEECPADIKALQALLDAHPEYVDLTSIVTAAP